MKKERLDKFLVDHGFFETREKAKKAIMAGLVTVDGQVRTKAGDQLTQDTPPEKITVKGNAIPYVSRGGLKLEKALRVFDFPVAGMTFLDIGASTGGFTDCLLQNGAAKVYAVDVGYGQLDWKLRNDSRVVSMERTNFRNLADDAIPEVVDGTVMDVSFISITKLLERIHHFMKADALGVWLIKPQFEAGREKVGKHGVVRDKKTHTEVLQTTLAQIQAQGFAILDLDFSPIQGPKGNIEFLCLSQKSEALVAIQNFDAKIDAVVTAAHENYSKREGEDDHE